MSFHQGVPEISSLFKRRLGVWQWFSSAWCSILLEGGRWFRRFLRRHWQAPSTHPHPRPPPLVLILLPPLHAPHTGNTESDLNSRWVWQLPSRRPVCVCTVYRINVCRSVKWKLRPVTWPWLSASPAAPPQNSCCWFVGHFLWRGHWKNAGRTCFLLANTVFFCVCFVFTFNLCLAFTEELRLCSCSATPDFSTSTTQWDLK